MVDDISTEHESFGLLSFSRVQSNVAKHLFGSSIKHQNTIRMKINRAEENRGLNRYWFYPKEQIVEIEMSYSQFTEAITSMNTSGVPCTILYVDRQKMEDPPGQSQRELFEKEFEEKVHGVTNLLEDLKRMSSNILDKPGGLKAAEKESIKGLINKIVMEVRQNLPFIQNSYNKALDKTTMEAKSEIESFINHQVHTLGLEAFKKQFIQIETDSTDAEFKEIEDKGE